MATINKTKAQLAESMKQLMQTMPLEKISVGDIVEHAKIGRNTFYYHFEDKYDLVIWIFQTESSPLFGDRLEEEDWCVLVERLGEYLCQNRDFYRNALSYDGQNSLQEYIYRQFEKHTLRRMRLHQETLGMALQPQELELAVSFFASALQGQMVRWVKQGMHPSSVAYRESLTRVLQLLGEEFAGTPQPTDR